MTDELLDVGIGQQVRIRENGSEIVVDVLDVQDDPPTSRYGSAIPGRRCLICRDVDGNPWRVAVVYEFDGFHGLTSSQLKVQRGFENTLIDDWAWEHVSADVSLARAERGVADD